jgi:hypothetical protein
MRAMFACARWYLVELTGTSALEPVLTFTLQTGADTEVRPYTVPQAVTAAGFR